MLELGRCVNCGLTILRGVPYITNVDGPRGRGIAHKLWCPRIAADGEPAPVPQVELTLRPGPPEAS